MFGELAAKFIRSIVLRRTQRYFTYTTAASVIVGRIRTVNTTTICKLLSDLPDRSRLIGYLLLYYCPSTHYRQQHHLQAMSVLNRC